MRLKQILKDLLTQKELAFLVGGYDVVGDIAVVTIPLELQHRQDVIGQAVLAANRRLKVVAKRAGHYGGEFRTLPLEIIAGENRKETFHKEHGILLNLHLEKVYFSVRSGEERRRIAALVQKNEEVLVLFSGIAAFPLIIAHLSPSKRIVGIEKNPSAHFYGLKNLTLNKKIKNVQLCKGDVADFLPRLTEKYDRVLMPLPSQAENYLDLALMRLKSRGILHFYDFQQKGRYEAAVKKIMTACEQNGRQLIGTEVVACGHIAPRKHRICVDAEIA